MKYLLLLIPALAFGQSLQLTPSTISVAQGGAVTITADRPVKFQLNGSGGITVTQGTSTVYSPPAWIPTQHVMAGCMVTPNDSVFNTRVDALPVHGQSNTWIGSLGFLSITPHFAWGINIVDNSTPASPQTFSKTTQLNDTLFQIPAQTVQRRENGALTQDQSNPHHLLIINRENCQIYETNQSGISQPSCPKCTAASGWTYSSTSYAQPSSNVGGGTADEGGLPLAPLLLHLSELKSGYVNHALRLEACDMCIGPNALWPATTAAGTRSGAPPVGARFRLKSGVDISQFSSQVQPVLTALKRYGMILAGYGKTGGISIASDVSQDLALYTALQALSSSGLAASDFEAVDESLFMYSASSNRVVPKNPYQTPTSFATVTVTEVANSANVVVLPIAIESVTTGTTETEFTVQAGTPSFKLPYWVNGATNTNMTWSLYPTSGAGSIDSNGVYTAPATVNGPTKVNIRGVSVADHTVSLGMYATILPSGVIRLNTGSNTTTQDSLGFTWLPNVGFEAGQYTQVQDASSWGSFSNSPIYQSYLYTAGDDLTYKMRVPNGNYLVQMMLGVGNCSGSYSTSQNFDSGLVWGPLTLQAQGLTQLNNWDYGVPTNHTCRRGETIDIPAQVKDSTLTFSLRATGGDYLHSAALLNGLTITPVAQMPTTTQFQMSTTASASSVTMNLLDFDSACGQPNYNCRTAFQNAFNVLAQNGGGVLNLPAGTFLIDFPEVPQNVASAGNLSQSSLLAVPANTMVRGHVGADGTPDTTVQWRVTNIPVFTFAKSSHSGLSNLHVTFIGTAPTAYAYGDMALVSNLGYKPAILRTNQMVSGSYELFSFAFVFDSEFCTFNNLVFDSAIHDNDHVFGYAINLKGKSLIMSGGSGLAELANGNTITNVNIYDHNTSFLVSGQNGLVMRNILADRRGSLTSIPPGHVLYTTGTSQWDASGNITNTMSNTNLMVDTITEGPITYSNDVALGTLAIKSVTGGTIQNIVSQHPAGLLQTYMALQNVTFKNMSWQSDSVLCDQAPSNCNTPVINSVVSLGTAPNSANLIFQNISVAATGRPISTSFLGDNVQINGITIRTSPLPQTGQTSAFAVIGVSRTAGTVVTNYDYWPLLNTYNAQALYNVPFEAWNPSSNVSVQVTVHWPSSLPTPNPRSPVVTPVLQNKNVLLNNSVSSQLVLQ